MLKRGKNETKVHRTAEKTGTERTKANNLVDEERWEGGEAAGAEVIYKCSWRQRRGE
jgi:hypothetical protein